MFGKAEDLRFANDVRAALEQESTRTGWLVLVTVTAAMASAITWAAYAELEEVTKGQGRVIPSSLVQVVETLEGGIIRELLVREGQLVDKGQVLARIDDTRFASELGELKQQLLTREARVARLTAEAKGKTAPDFGALGGRKNDDILARERSLFEARQEQLKADAEVAGQQLKQREQQLVEIQTSRDKLSETLALAEKELSMTRKLFNAGALPEIEFIKFQREISQIRGELEKVVAALPRVEAAIKEARSNVERVRSNFLAEAQTDLSQSTAELSIIHEKLKAARDRVTRTELTAPVRGIVNKLNTNTVGRVVGPGGSLMEIVPIDDTLLIEAQIIPKDVAFIHPEQSASVKLTAYDYTVYGDLPGKVERVGADTITDDQGLSFYRVIVRTDKTKVIGPKGNTLPIIPGMVAEVDILTGNKTVLEYLIQPFKKAQTEAMRER